MVVTYYGDKTDLAVLKLQLICNATSTPLLIEAGGKARLRRFVCDDGRAFLSVGAAAAHVFKGTTQQGPLLEWAAAYLTDAVILHVKKCNTLATAVLSELALKLDKRDCFGGANPDHADYLLFADMHILHEMDRTLALPSHLESWYKRLHTLSQPALTHVTPAIIKTIVSQHVVRVPKINVTEAKVVIFDTAMLRKQLADALPDHSRKTRRKEVLPVKGARNLLVTAALPYVNNVPHLGNIIGCVLSADVYVRYCRLVGHNTLFVSGTDEYGTATETRALVEGVTPQQLCDKYSAIHRQVYDWFNIDFDYFGRTTTPQQTAISQELFWSLHKGGHIHPDTIQQLHCGNCNTFLADRFAEGECPLCHYADARGDQCDGCGKLLNAVELIRPVCKTCGKSPVIRETRHLFLNLPGLEPRLSRHLDSVWSSGLWTENSINITRSWIRDGLKARCITRDLKWGTACPLEGFTDKVFYVWFDAPVGYMSITANYTPQWRRWWQNPEEVELTHFMAKDNVPFHSVIFPSSLIGSAQPWTLVKNLSATEYLNYEDTKFSKSRGTGVFGDEAAECGIPADVMRFYLLCIRPESSDSAFAWSDLQVRLNSELLNNIGNFVHRSLRFVEKFFAFVVPYVSLLPEDLTFLAAVDQEIADYVATFEKQKLRDGTRHLLNITRLGNGYIQASEPWRLMKGGPSDVARAQTVVGVAAQVVAALCPLMEPFMPAIADELRHQLAMDGQLCLLEPRLRLWLPPNHRINQPAPLFARLEDDRVEELRKKYAGQGPPQKATVSATTTESSAELEAQIAAQGDAVRVLKSSGADKSVVKAEVEKLLALKSRLGTATVAPKPAGPPVTAQHLEVQITMQGNVVRDLKAAKADKATIKSEVDKLLALKSQLAAVAPANTDRKEAVPDKKVSNDSAKLPQPTKTEAVVSATPSGGDCKSIADMEKQVAAQGDKVRQLKASNADKAVVKTAVDELLSLKTSLGKLAGAPPPALAEGKKKKKK